ncbi:MAG: carbonic anhydrase [Bacteroidota bacterium]
MDIIDKIFLQNKAWAEDKLNDDPDFFIKLKIGQKPDFFWIGCSDSRVPANEITNTASGQIFVHRNIANMVVSTDMNLMSGLQFAVEELKVKHVIVCGHYGCGGIKAALSDKHHGLINKWVRNIKDVYRLHRDEINSVPNNDSRVNKLVELNVIEQTHNVSKTSIVQQAWINGDGPHLHGWVYDLSDGLLRRLIHIKPGDPIDPIYKYSDLEADE